MNEKLPTPEIAARYGVGPATVIHWVRRGLPSTRNSDKPQSHHWFDPAEVEAWLREESPPSYRSVLRSRAAMPLDQLISEIRERGYRVTLSPISPDEQPAERHAPLPDDEEAS